MNSNSRQWEEAVIREKCKESNSYMVELPETRQCFRRNSNFMKPRQSEDKSKSTRPGPPPEFPEIPQEAPVIQQEVPSSPTTSTVDAISTVPSLKQKRNSTPQAPKTSAGVNKGVLPSRLGLQE